jgi:hypothetical protein
LLNFLDQQLASFSKDSAGADKLISLGAADRQSSVSAVHLAAWTMTANVLLNLDETLNKE